MGVHIHTVDLFSLLREADHLLWVQHNLIFLTKTLIPTSPCPRELGLCIRISFPNVHKTKGSCV